MKFIHDYIRLARGIDIPIKNPSPLQIANMKYLLCTIDIANGMGGDIRDPDMAECMCADEDTLCWESCEAESRIRDADIACDCELGDDACFETCKDNSGEWMRINSASDDSCEEMCMGDMRCMAVCGALCEDICGAEDGECLENCVDKRDTCYGILGVDDAAGISICIKTGDPCGMYCGPGSKFMGCSRYCGMGGSDVRPVTYCNSKYATRQVVDTIVVKKAVDTLTLSYAQDICALPNKVSQCLPGDRGCEQGQKNLNPDPPYSTPEFDFVSTGGRFYTYDPDFYASHPVWGSTNAPVNFSQSVYDELVRLGITDKYYIQSICAFIQYGANAGDGAFGCWCRSKMHACGNRNGTLVLQRPVELPVNWTSQDMDEAQAECEMSCPTWCASGVAFDDEFRTQILQDISSENLSPSESR